MSRCLYCYGELAAGESLLHMKCARRVFSLMEAPKLHYTTEQIAECEGRELIVPKGGSNLQFVDVDGEYTLLYGGDDGVVAQLEALTMRMGEVARISVAPHSLLYDLKGHMHHITRHLVRPKRGVKIERHRLSEYHDGGVASYEKAAEILKRHSTTAKLDIINLYERVLFGYLVGVTDMTLDSFSIVTRGSDSSLAAASRLLPRGFISGDTTLAMPLNGKCEDLVRADFEVVMLSMGIEKKIIDNMFGKFERMIDVWYEVIDCSPLGEDLRESLKFQIVIRSDAFML